MTPIRSKHTDKRFLKLTLQERAGLRGINYTYIRIQRNLQDPVNEIVWFYLDIWRAVKKARSIGIHYVETELRLDRR